MTHWPSHPFRAAAASRRAAPVQGLAKFVRAGAGQGCAAQGLPAHLGSRCAPMVRQRPCCDACGSIHAVPHRAQIGPLNVDRLGRLPGQACPLVRGRARSRMRVRCRKRYQSGCVARTQARQAQLAGAMPGRGCSLLQVHARSRVVGAVQGFAQVASPIHADALPVSPPNARAAKRGRPATRSVIGSMLHDPTLLDGSRARDQIWMGRL